MNLKMTKTVATILAAVTISTQILPIVSLAAEKESETQVVNNDSVIGGTNDEVTSNTEIQELDTKISNFTIGTISSVEYSIGNQEITGSYTGEVAKARVTINGQVQGWGGAFFGNSQFSYYVGAGKIKAGDTVTITAYDKNDKVLDADKKVTIREDVTQGTITPAEFLVNDTHIVGSYTGEVAKAVVIINGQAQAWGGSFTNGQFSYYIGADKIKVGDVVSIIAYDKNNKALDGKNVIIKEAGTQGTIIPAEFSIYDTQIVGSYTGEVSKARVTINGQAQAWGGSFTNGQFSYYIGVGKIKSGDTVTITAYDKNDKVVDVKNVTIKEDTTQGTITPAKFSINDTQIVGSYTGDVSTALITINGQAQPWGGSFTNGQFNYYIGAGKIKAGDAVMITAFDKDYNALDIKRVTIKEDGTQGKISPAEYSIEDDNITGSYTGDVAKACITINGQVQSEGGVFWGNGQFSYYIGAGKIKARDTVTITAYDKNDKVLDANKLVKVKDAVHGTLTASVYNVGETTIKGSYTGDIVKARVLINGEAQAWGGTFSGGNFSYYIGSGKIKAGDTVEIVGYDVNDVELTAQVVTVKD